MCLNFRGKRVVGSKHGGYVPLLLKDDLGATKEGKPIPPLIGTGVTTKKDVNAVIKKLDKLTTTKPTRANIRFTL